MSGALPIGRLRTQAGICTPRLSYLISDFFRLVAQSSGAFLGGPVMIKAITVPREK